MKYLYRWLLVLSSAGFFIASAQAQNAGTVTNHAFVIGKGAGTTGYTSLLCASAQLAVGQSSADPICRTMSGDATLAASGALTLATVNSNVGTFGSATKCTAFTTNAKGLITAASETTCTPALASITGLGTGVATALAVNVGSAGAFVTFNGALGTPSSGTLTNATGLPVSTGISGLGTGIATWLATPSSANLASALTDETGSGAAVFGTAPTITGGTHTALTGLGIRSTGASFDVRFAATEVLTADRTLTWVLGDAARTITLSGNLTINSSTSITAGSTGTWPIWTAGNLSGASSATLANAAAPSSPSAGNVAMWMDSTDLRFHDKNASGVIGTTVVADTGTANNYISAISAAGAITKSRPTCSTLSDSTTLCTTTPGTGVATFLTTPSSANLASALTDETGSGAAMFGTAPTMSAPTVSGLANFSGAVKYSTQSAPSQITSNQNDYNPSSVNCATSTTLLINSDAARDITGLAGGVAGCQMMLINNGAFTITLKEASGSSSAANRFNTGGDIALASNASVTLLYDGTASRWRMASPAASGGGGGTVTSVVCNGVTITTSGTCPPTYGLVNHSLAASASGSALTIALKDNAGSDPSASSPVNGYFRNVTGTTGSLTQLSVTGALSLTISSGSTMGVTSSTAFRIWVVLFNDGGTARLGAINCVSITGSPPTAAQIYPLTQGQVASSTAEGGAGAADSAGVIYTGTAVTSKAYLIVGYVEWSSSGLTAGTWTTSNLLYVQSFGPGIATPGQVVQTAMASTGTGTSTTSSTYTATNVTISTTPTSAANLIRAEITGTAESDADNVAVDVALHRDGTRVMGGTGVITRTSGGTLVYNMSSIAQFYLDKPNKATSTTYAAYVRNSNNSSTVLFPTGGLNAETPYGAIVVTEIMG